MKVSFLVTYYNQKDPTINAAIDTFKEKNCGWILGFQLKMVGSILTKVLFPKRGIWRKNKCIRNVEIRNIKKEQLQ